MKFIFKIFVFGLIIISCTNLYGQNIFTASYNGDLKTVKKLINKNPDLVNSRNSIGRFPLENAAQTGQLEVVKFLLKKGADINMERNGATALHLAAIYGGKTELILLLLEKGAKINGRTNSGETPLNFAVSGKQKEIAELLIEKGGEINLRNQNHTHLLEISASAGITKIVNILLKKEVNFNYRTRNGNTLLHSAAQGGILEFTKLLLSKGLKAEAANIYGQTPLHIAAGAGHKKVVDLLLKKNVNINSKTKNGKTPFHFAQANGHKGVVEYLRKKGADNSRWELPRLSGKYLGQTRPKYLPRIFAPGIVSEQEGFEHSNLAFSPDYTEIYWSTDYNLNGFFNIVFIKKENNRWSSPKLAPFVEKYQSGQPVFSSDGKKLFFNSNQPMKKNDGSTDHNIWFVEKIGKRWSEAKPLGAIINTEKRESMLSVSKYGTLYFRRDMELLSSKRKNGVFQTPQKLDIKLKTGARNGAITIAPDESFMVIESFGGGYGGSGDLYVSYKQKDNTWTEPKNFGRKINSPGHERFPSITPDGKYLFFLRVSEGSDFFWVDAKIINKIKDMKYSDIFSAMDLIIGEKGIDSAVNLYWELKKKHPDFYNFSEQMLNYLGYKLMNEKKLKEAIKIFKLNVKVFPDSANLYDSLAESYMKNGEKELAIKNYKQSLKLDPTNDNARKMLKELLK